MKSRNISLILLILFVGVLAVSTAVNFMDNEVQLHLHKEHLILRILKLMKYEAYTMKLAGNVTKS